jgi:hypothetical protein
LDWAPEYFKTVAQLTAADFNMFSFKKDKMSWEFWLIKTVLQQEFYKS